MRRIAITILVLAYTVGLKAQELTPTAKGNFMIGGSAGYSSSKNEQATSESFQLAPLVGYFIIDRLAIGATPLYEYDKTEFKFNSFQSDFLNTKSNGLSFAPFARYIFDSGIFTQIEGGAGRKTIKKSTKKYTNESEHKISSSYFQTTIGYSYFINSKIGIEFAAYFNYSSIDIKDDSYTNIPPTQGSNNTYGLKIGIQAYL
jgi:hypothetical protein